MESALSDDRGFEEGKPPETHFEALPKLLGLVKIAPLLSDNSKTGRQLISSMKAHIPAGEPTCRRCVSFELRWGTCGFLEASAANTSPRALRDLLMLQASFCRCPSACDLFSRSLHRIDQSQHTLPIPEQKRLVLYCFQTSPYQQ